MKISRQYVNSSTWGIVAAVEHVLLDNYGLSLDDCGFAYRDFESCHSFTLTIPKRVNDLRFLGLLSDYVFVGPPARDLF